MGYLFQGHSPGHQNPQMLKSLIYNGTVFANNLCTSFRKLETISGLLTIPNAKQILCRPS